MSFMVERAIGSTAASGAAISSWYLLRYLLLLLHGLLFLRFLELSPLGDFESLYSFDDEVAGAREASLSSLACLSVRRGCFCLDFGMARLQSFVATKSKVVGGDPPNSTEAAFLNV